MSKPYRRVSILALLAVLLLLSLSVQGSARAIKFQATMAATKDVKMAATMAATRESSLAATREATQSVTSQVTPGAGQILYKETFDSNAVDWETDQMPTVDNGQGRALSILRNGVYHIEWEPPQADSNWIIAPGFNNFSLAPIFKGDYDYQIEVSNLSSKSGKYTVGIIINDQNKYHGFDEFLIDQDGTWIADSWQDINGPSTLLTGGTISPVDFTKGTHTLGVRVEGGSTFHFRVDGQEIDQTVIDSTFSSGTIGMILGGAAREYPVSVTADFDNAIVRAPGKQ